MLENLGNSKFTSSMFFHPLSALKLLYGNFVLQAAAEANFGFTHRVDAEAAIADVLNKLQEEIGDQMLFCSERAEVSSISSLDIIAYGFLKQLQINFPQTPLVSQRGLS